MPYPTRIYSDLDAVFEPNPLTGDLLLRTNESAIKASIRNLILTRNYERPFNSSIGSQINRYLFEIIDDTSIIVMKQVISRCIANNEPRVDLTSVNISSKPDQQELIVSIAFNIKNNPRPLNLTIILDRTR